MDSCLGLTMYVILDNLSVASVSRRSICCTISSGALEAKDGLRGQSLPRSKSFLSQTKGFVVD